jgi:hypothetical protein
MMLFDHIGQYLILLDHIGHLTTHVNIKYYPISFDYVGHDLTMLQLAPLLSSGSYRFPVPPCSGTILASFSLP